MPIHDARLFRNFSGKPAMQKIFSAHTRVENFIRIKVALAKVEASLNIIPQSAYAEIALRAPALQVNWDRLRREGAACGDPALSLMRQLGEICGGASEYLHWSSTARQVSETAFALQIVEGMALVEGEVQRVRELLQCLGELHRSTVMAPRCGGMPAPPTTFGVRCELWLDEVDRQQARLKRVRAGLAGDIFRVPQALGPRSDVVRAGLLRELGLPAAESSGAALRDRISDCVFALATVSSAIAGMAATIACLADDRLIEYCGDAAGIGPDGISRQCLQVKAHAGMAAGNVAAAMDSALGAYDGEQQGPEETELVPQTLLLVHEAVADMVAILSGIQVFPDRMRAHFDSTRGLVMAENVMQMLALRSGRRSAYRMVSRACEAALCEGLTLREVLLRNRDVTALLSPQEIDHALDPVRGD